MSSDEPVFVIDGTEYTVPGLDSMTMGEAVTLYEYSGLSIDEVKGKKARTTVVLAALMHIAYARKHPELDDEEIKELVRGSKLMDVFARMMEESADPPPEAPASESPPPSSSDSATSSGADSTVSSDELAAIRARTGTSG